MKKQKGKHDYYMKGGRRVFMACVVYGANGEALSDLCVPLVRVVVCLLVVSSGSGSRSKGWFLSAVGASGSFGGGGEPRVQH